jgi:hypothetical protein
VVAVTVDDDFLIAELRGLEVWRVFDEELAEEEGLIAKFCGA